MKASILSLLSLFPCIVPSIVVLVIIPSVLQNSTGYVIAFLIIILVLLLYKYLAQEEPQIDSSSSFGPRSSFANFPSVIIPSVYVAAVVAVIVTPADYSLYLDWSGIPFLNWPRLIAVFLLTSFLPGYVILKTIDNKREINGAANLVFSFLLSFLVTTMMGLALELTGNKISQYGFPTLVTTSVSFIALLLFSDFRNNRRKQEYSSRDSRNDKNYLKVLILLCLVVLQCLLLYTVFFINQSFLRGDMWSHFADVSNLLKYGFGMQSTLSGYFWGYRIFNAGFLILGGFPLINAEVMLVFLYPISIIAFYSMVSVFFKSREKVSIVGTVIWATFSGFDWVYLVCQGVIPGKFSFDAAYSILSKTMSGGIYPYATFGYDHLTFVVSMTSIFMLLYMFERSRLSTNIRVFLIAVTTLLGYMVHSPEVMLFVILFVPCLIVFSKEESITRVRTGLIAMLLGLVAMLFLDFSTPGEPIYTTSYALPLSIILVCVAIPSTYIVRRISLRKTVFRVLTYKHAQKLLAISSLILCYLYFLSFIILSDSPLSSEGFSIGTLQKVIPWFAYPLRLGVAGILLMASIIYLVRTRRFSRKILFFLAITFLSIVFGSMYAILYPKVVATTHERIFYMMFVAVPIAAAWIVPRIFSRIIQSNHSSSPSGSSFRKMARRFLASLFLVAIVLGGSLSSLISVDFWAVASGPYGLPQQNMPQDMEALTLLRLKSPFLSTVAANTVSTGSINSQVVTLASVQALDTDQFDTWFGTTQPEVLFAMKNLLNISYVYFSSEDLAAITKRYPDSFFVNHLLKYLPRTTFRNSNVTLYELPPLSPPSGRSALSLSIVIPQEVEENIYLSIDTFASSQLQYDFALQPDPNKFEASTIVLPFDPVPPDWELNSIEVADENQTGFWIPTSWGSGSIGTPIMANDNTTRIKGIDCLRIVVGNGSESNWGIYHDYGPTQDWSGKETFSLYWDGANTSVNFKVEIRTPDEANREFYAFADDFLGWKQIVFSLKKPEREEGTFNISKIRRIFIYPNSKNVTGSWQLDRIQVSLKVISLPEYQIKEYSNWLDNGGHLVVFDNYGLGYFASLLGLKTIGNGTADSIGKQDASVSVGGINITEVEMDNSAGAAIANYTRNGYPVSPFAVAKSLGKGQLTYVLVKSFYDAIIDSDNETLKVEMFSKLDLTEFFNVISSSYRQSAELQMLSPTRVGISATNATFSGLVEIKSSSIVFDQIELSMLDLKSTNFIDKNESNTHVDNLFSNVTLLELTVDGSSTFDITANKAQIDKRKDFPEDLSSYLPLTFEEGFNMTLSFPNETYVTMRLGANNSVMSVVAHGGVIEARSSEMKPKVLVRTPDITIKGRTFLEKAWFRRPYAVYQRFSCYGLPIELDGTTSLEVSLSESEKIHLSNFAFEGTYRIFDDPLTSRASMFFSYEAWDVNWSEILLSPWHIMLLVFITVLFLILSGYTIRIQKVEVAG